MSSEWTRVTLLGRYDVPLPVTVSGADLHTVANLPDVPSARDGSAGLTAGLQVAGPISVLACAATPDHTERARGAFGVAVGIGAHQAVGVTSPGLSDVLSGLCG